MHENISLDGKVDDEKFNYVIKIILLPLHAAFQTDVLPKTRSTYAC